jgi:ribose 5-phosphate isomerase B
MKIALGCDHRGFGVKQRMLKLLESHGNQVYDTGCFSNEYVDYPDFAVAVAQRVGGGDCERGILICGTGIGMAIAANKVLGVRAAPCHDLVTAEMSRRHNDANVLCLSADLLGEEMIERIVKLWLETPFEGGRHARRVDKIMKYESKGNEK